MFDVPPESTFFFTVLRRGSFGRILTMQLEPPKKLSTSSVNTGARFQACQLALTPPQWRDWYVHYIESLKFRSTR